LWVARLRGREAFWVADLPSWLEYSSDLYCPARAVEVRVGDRIRDVNHPCLKYAVPIEVKLKDWVTRWNNWLYRYTGKNLIRDPLGKPIDSSFGIQI
jgi:hypothetical protein